jgi:hypothetical protein
MNQTNFSKQEYLLELEEYSKILKAGTDISKASGGIKTSTRFIRSTQIFTRMTVMAFTFYRLLPGNPITNDDEEHWDWPTIASVARNFLEAYLHFFYLSEKRISDHEADFRLKLMWFHLNSEKFRLYKSGPQKKDLSDFEKNLPKQKNQLKMHQFFTKLNKNAQKRALSGKSAIYMTTQELINRLPFKSDELLWLYRHFSNEVHSTAFAFSSQSNERGRGDENEAERVYIITASWTVRKYFSAAIISMSEIFPNQLKASNPKAIEIAQGQFQKFISDN